MHAWKNDPELIQLIKEKLFSAVIGDVMDKSGFLHQFISPKILPLRTDMRLVGRAMSVLEVDCLEEISSGSLSAYAHEH